MLPRPVGEGCLPGHNILIREAVYAHGADANARVNRAVPLQFSVDEEIVIEVPDGSLAAVAGGCYLRNIEVGHPSFKQGLPLFVPYRIEAELPGGIVVPRD